LKVMHSFRPQTLIATAAVLLGLTFGPLPAAPRVEAAWDSETQAFLSLINSYRAQNGLSTLAGDALLQNAANWLGDDMLAHCVGANDCSHTDSAGRSFVQRLVAFSYPAGISAGAGEIIAWGTGGTVTTAQQVFTAWKNSAGHDADMLNASYRAIGVARSCSGGSCAWVADFGTAVVQGSGAGVPGDVNGSGCVDVNDLSAVAAAYGSLQRTDGHGWAVDVNGDGKVDVNDLSLVASNYGRCG